MPKRLKMLATDRDNYKRDLQNLQTQYAAYRSENEAGRVKRVPDALAESVALFTDSWRDQLGVQKIANDLGVTKGYLYKLAVRGRELMATPLMSPEQVDELRASLRSATPTEPEQIQVVRRVAVTVDLNDPVALSRFDDMYMLIRGKGDLALALEAAAKASTPTIVHHQWRVAHRAVAPPAPVEE
jgi:hypothetical protein